MRNCVSYFLNVCAERNFAHATRPAREAHSIHNESKIIKKQVNNHSNRNNDNNNYDNANDNSLINTLPIHMKENSSNEQFFLFLDMIGQHFDTIWTYINHLTNVTQRKEQKTEGMPQDIIYHVVKSMGHQLYL